MLRKIFFFFVLFIIITTSFCLADSFYLERKLSDLVRKKYGSFYSVEVKSIYLPGIIKDNQSKAVVRVDEDIRLYGKVIVPVFFKNKKYNAVFSIRLYRDVFVACKNIMRGDILGYENMEKKRSDVTSLLRFLPEEGFEKNLNEAIRTIPAGNIVLKKMMVPRYVAKRGDEVTIVAQNGRITVECSGKILQNAYLNDEVSVENLSSNKKVIGVLTAPGRVFLKKYLR